MRFVDNSNFTPPATWTAKVPNALANYTNKGEFLPIWKELLHDLNRLLRQDTQIKCWYTEAIILQSNVDVDHFRPKSNVKGLANNFASLEDAVWQEIELANRNGYTWLAFDYKNFRVASQHSNQGRKEGKVTLGKQDFFPLKRDSPIGTSEEDYYNEDIVLLDPCNASDPDLLKFDASGQVDAAYPHGTWEYCRAKISIEIYHLNFDLRGLKDARLEHWNKVKNDIELLNCFYTLRHQNQILSADFLDNLDSFESKIKKHVSTSEQFSAVAIDCIKHYRLNYPFLTTLFPNLQK